MYMQDIALNWSSGKDAAMAYYYLQQSNTYRVKTLLTSLSETYNRVSMHGTPAGLLEAQAQKMQLPLKQIHLPENADMETYNGVMQTAVNELKTNGIHTFAFGDIFLEDLKAYREAQLAKAGATAIFPLWKKDTRELVAQLEDTGIKAMIICVHDKFLGKEFLGRFVNRELLDNLPDNVDPCGENGEFHSVVIDAPFFSEAIPVSKGEIVYKNYAASQTDDKAWHSGFYFLDVQPVT
jgi:uncharacterized protein (TIGR00290 family)